MEQEERRPETRQKILDAAASAMIEAGLPRTTTKEVARRSGLSEGAIYLYFESKKQLFAAVVRERLLLPSLSFEIDEEAGLEIREALIRIVERMLERHRETIPLLSALLADHELGSLVMQEPPGGGRFEGLHRFADFIAARQARGEIPAGDPIIIARVLLGTAFHHAYLSSTFGEDRIQPSGRAFVEGLVDAALT